MEYLDVGICSDLMPDLRIKKHFLKQCNRNSVDTSRNPEK